MLKPCCLECLGASNAGVHLFSFRTQKLSPVVPMVVLPWSARVGRCQDFRDNIFKPSNYLGGFFVLVIPTKRAGEREVESNTISIFKIMIRLLLFS
jgi:hypothetical protein